MKFILKLSTSAKHVLLTTFFAPLFVTIPLGAAIFNWDALNGNWTSINVGGSGTSNWTSGGVDVNTFPNSTTDDAVFDQAGTAAITGAINVNNLDLNDSGAEINILQTSLTAAGDINNGGTISLSATSSFRTASLNVGGTLTNSGTIQYTRFTGTNLTLAADVNNLASGLIRLADNVRVNYNQANGILSNDGTVSLGTGASLNFSSGESFTQTANATISNNGSFNIGAGATFNLNGGNMTGNAVLVSDGTINFGAGSSTANANFTAQRATTWTGDIGSGTQIHVEATFNDATFTHDGDVSNAGTIEVDSSTASFRAAKLSVGAGNTLTNTGEIIFRSVNGTASTLTVEGNLDNQGQVTFEGGQTTNYSVAGATHTNSGTYTLESGSILNINTGVSPTDTTTFTNEEGGRIEGSGNFRSNLTLFGNRGTIAPGSSAGELTITGRVGFTDTSIIEIEIGGLVAGSEHDLLSITESISLDGNLNISFLGTFYQDITAFDSFTIIGADEIGGTFDNLDMNNRVDTTDGRGSFLVTINETNVVLEQFLPIPEPSAYALIMAFGATIIAARRRAIKV